MFFDKNGVYKKMYREYNTSCEQKCNKKIEKENF